jgi:hypothetical protein
MYVKAARRMLVKLTPVLNLTSDVRDVDTISSSLQHQQQQRRRQQQQQQQQRQLASLENVAHLISLFLWKNIYRVGGSVIQREGLKSSD